MTEDPHTDSPAVPREDSRLRQALAWVAIVAGVVFIVAVVFFSGFALGRGDGYHGWPRGHPGSQSGPGQPGKASCPMMSQTGMSPGTTAPALPAS